MNISVLWFLNHYILGKRHISETKEIGKNIYFLSFSCKLWHRKSCLESRIFLSVDMCQTPRWAPELREWLPAASRDPCAWRVMLPPHPEEEARGEKNGWARVHGVLFAVQNTSWGSVKERGCIWHLRKQLQKIWITCSESKNKFVLGKKQT